MRPTRIDALKRYDTWKCGKQWPNEPLLQGNTAQNTIKQFHLYLTRRDPVEGDLIFIFPERNRRARRLRVARFRQDDVNAIMGDPPTSFN